MAINLSDETYGRVMRVVGYPIVSLEDLTGGRMDKQQILDLVIKDALVEYWSWFPKKNLQEYKFTGEFSVNFPNENVIGVLDARTVQRGLSGSTTGRTGNPFVDAVNYSMSTSSYSGGVFGTKYNYGMDLAYSQGRNAYQAVSDKNSVFKLDLDYVNKLATGYNNSSDIINITWAEYSDNFSDIPVAHQNDVIKLMQSYLLFFFGDLRNQTADSSPVDLDGSDFVSRAEDLKSEVIEKWKNKPKIVVVR